MKHGRHIFYFRSFRKLNLISCDANNKEARINKTAHAACQHVHDNTCSSSRSIDIH